MTPDGWGGARIGEVCSVVTGGTPSRRRRDFWGGTIPWMSSGEIHQRRVTKTREAITEAGFAASSARWIPAGAVMVALNGQGKTRGTAAILKRKVTCNQSLAAVVPRNDVLVADYLFQYLSAKYAAIRRLTGDGGRNGLNLGHIRSIEVACPPLAEQRKIAAILSSVDDAIETTQAVIDQVQVVKRCLMHELLTRGLPGRHTRFQKTEVGEIPASWTVAALSDAVFFQEGPGLRKWLFQDHGRPFLNIRCIRDDGTLDLSSVQYIAEEKAAKSYRHFFLDENDTVLSSSGTLGRMAVVRDVDLPLMLNTSVIRFRTLSEDVCCTSYMRAFLSSDVFRHQILRESQGSAQPNFGPTHLKKVRIPLPPEAEQRAIATAVTLHSERLMVESAYVDRLRQLKSALMSVLLTGELRVTPDPEPE